MLGVAALVGGMVQASAAAAAPPDRASADARKATVRRYIQIWESGRVERLGTVIADGYAGHAASGSRDIAGLRQRIADFHLAFPDMRFTIHDQIIHGDRVATRMSAVGTSAKTGQRVRMVGVNISRFSDNRIVEEWPVWEVAP